MKLNHDQYIQEIARLMSELNSITSKERITQHELKLQRASEALLLTHNKTMQTLNLGLFSALEDDQIYSLVCESLVYQVGWDSAFVVSLKVNRLRIHASHGATQLQEGSVKDYLAVNREFSEAYAGKQTISTFHSSSPSSLALRSLFHTDEVAAVPILFGERIYGYIVVCSHTMRTSTRALQDLDFLSVVAAQVGHAVQKSSVFKDLEDQNTKLRELDELKNSFISITSHQLRTPLSIVKWILSILQTDSAITPLPNQLKMIEQAYSSNERLIHVVNDLLNISRIQEGRLPYSPQLTDISVMLHDLCTSTAKAAELQLIHITCDISSELPLCEVDPLLFKESLQNVLDNAIDYNVPHGWINIKAQVVKSTIYISISNSGQGIQPKDQAKIFNQFYRAPDAVKMHPNGNGLGLYLAQAIARQHGGDIMCESTYGKEISFTVVVPIIHPT